MSESTNTNLAWYGNVIFRNVLVYSVLIDFAFVGCLESGYYGPDCSIPCPDPHCRYCHLETGVCQGCEAGYEGHHCELGLFVCLLGILRRTQTYFTYMKTSTLQVKGFKFFSSEDI